MTPFTLIGLSSLIIVFGQIGGPILAGVFADWTGNYRMGFTILAVLAAAESREIARAGDREVEKTGRSKRPGDREIGRSEDREMD